MLIVSDLGDVLAETIDAEAARTLRLAGILPKGLPLEKLVARVERLIGRPRPAEA